MCDSEKAKNVRRFLDARYKRVIQTSSANWGGNVVWSVDSDGISEGRFIFEDDDYRFILLDRDYNDDDGVIIVDLFTYEIGSGEISKLLNF
jgi:hypothetical protein